MYTVEYAKRLIHHTIKHIEAEYAGDKFLLVSVQFDGINESMYSKEASWNEVIQELNYVSRRIDELSEIKEDDRENFSVLIVHRNQVMLQFNSDDMNWDVEKESEDLENPAEEDK